MTVTKQLALQQFLAESQQRCQAFMADCIDALPALPTALQEAMRYACLGGGKRVRPALVYASARLCDQAAAELDPVAAAVEMIHCYSLVHDDLPAMDDDELRRGQPTVHRRFDQATAILAGDALQALAFDLLTEAVEDDPGLALQRIRILARAAGYPGMVGGQSIDMAFEQRNMSMDALERMHKLKTGAMIRASVELGALPLAVRRPEDFSALGHYAECIGLAFQVQDDILDVTADTGVLGKTGGADAARNKPTYVSLLGLQAARNRAAQLTDEALEALQAFGPEAQALRDIASYIAERDR